MSLSKGIRQKLRESIQRLRRRPFEQDLEQEIQSHLQLEIDQNIRAGMTPSEARDAARKKFGPVARSKEEARAVWGWTAIDHLTQDLRFAFRTLRKSPGFATVAILSLGLGIGANTAIFTVIYHVVLRPLPFPEPHRLVAIDERVSDRQTFLRGGPRRHINVLMRRDELQSFEDVAGYRSARAELSGAEEPEEIRSGRTSANLSEVMRIPPLIGRWFTPQEVEQRAMVAVLSYGLWQRQFGGRPGILGESLSVHSYGVQEVSTIVGVMPPGFRVTPRDEYDVWQPISNYSPYDKLEVWSPHYTVGRLKPGVSIDHAQAELTALQQRLYPGEEAKGRSLTVRSLAEDIVLQVRPGLLILLGAVGCVLLIACANLANLLLSRGIGRQREIAVRAALGASRGRLFAQVLAETALLGLLGGALGLALGWGGVKALLAISFQRLPRTEQVEIDATVLSFTLALSLITGLICGLLPARRASGVSFLAALKQGGGPAIGGRKERRVRNALVVAEIALAVLLVTGAGLFLNTFARLHAIDLGFDPENVLVVRVREQRGLERNAAARAAFQNQILDRVRSLAGVQSATSVSYHPLLNVYSALHILLPGQEPAEGERGAPANARTIGPDYFATLRIPLIKGRVFDERDDDEARGSVVINETMARQFWSGRDPIGEQFTLVRGRERSAAQVVGVVQDALQTALTEPHDPMLYVRNTHRLGSTDYVLVRTASEPLSFADAVKHEIRAVDPTQPLGNISTLEDALSNQVAERRFYMLLLSVFAALALSLAAVGLYGVIAYSTNRRTQEIGLRVALGADRGAVFRLIAREGLWLTVPGIALGIAGSLTLTRFLESWLYQVRPNDPLTLAAVAALLALVAALACLAPARRATKVDPMVALRYE